MDSDSPYLRTAASHSQPSVNQDAVGPRQLPEAISGSRSNSKVTGGDGPVPQRLTQYHGSSMSLGGAANAGAALPSMASQHYSGTLSSLGHQVLQPSQNPSQNNLHTTIEEEDMHELDRLERLRDGVGGDEYHASNSSQHTRTQGGHQQPHHGNVPVMEITENIVTPTASHAINNNSLAARGGAPSPGGASFEAQYVTTTVDAFLTCMKVSLDCFISHDGDPSQSQATVGESTGLAASNALAISNSIAAGTTSTNTLSATNNAMPTSSSAGNTVISNSPPPFHGKRTADAIAHLCRSIPRSGCKIVSIDGEKVSSSVDVRQILLRHPNEQDRIVIGFVHFYSQQQQMILLQQAIAHSNTTTSASPHNTNTVYGASASHTSKTLNALYDQGTGAPLSFSSHGAGVMGDGGGGVANNGNHNNVASTLQQGPPAGGIPTTMVGGVGTMTMLSPVSDANGLLPFQGGSGNLSIGGANHSNGYGGHHSSSGGGTYGQGGVYTFVKPLGPLGSSVGGGSAGVGVHQFGERSISSQQGQQQQQSQPQQQRGLGLEDPHSQSNNDIYTMNLAMSNFNSATTIDGAGGGMIGMGIGMGGTGAASTSGRFSARQHSAGAGYMRSSMADGDASQQFDRTPLEVLNAAVDRVQPWKCVILLHHQPPPPLRLVEEVARQKGAHITLLDAGITIHRRPRHDQTKDTMRAALELGDWLVLNNATKSMATLECLRQVIEEMRQADGGVSTSNMNINTDGSGGGGGALGDASTSGTNRAAQWVQRSARIIIIAEPHPHFPKALLSPGNVVFRHCDVRGDGASESRETLRESMARLRLLKASQAMLSTSQAASDLPGMRKVRISSNVDVVSYEQQAEQSMLIEEGFGLDGGVSAPEVRPECVSLQGEQFTCLEEAGDGRIAAGSSGGNVYIYTVKGLPLLTFHAHQCTVWGLDWRGHHEFVLGSEDACLSHWSHDIHCNAPGFRGQVITRFSSDVLAVRYVDPLRSDVAVAGGLNGSLCLVNVSTGKRLVVPTVSTILCLARVPQAPNKMLMGGGTGLVSLWDCDRGVPSDSYFHHKQKVSCVAAHHGMLLSSSFDGSVVVADLRMKSISFRLTPGGQQASPVSCMAQKGNTLAVAAEDSLYVYDLRKPPQLLHHRQNAWHSGHFARGLTLDDSEGYPIAIAASSDGILRFFGCA